MNSTDNLQDYFLNETRKAQFAEIFRNQLNVYYQGDAEVMLQSGRDMDKMRDSGLTLCCFGKVLLSRRPPVAI